MSEDPIADIQHQLNHIADALDTFSTNVSEAIHQISTDLQGLSKATPVQPDQHV